MPTISRAGPYRVYFFSHDLVEPPHVHVDRDDRSVKSWLEPIAVAKNRGFAQVELSRIERLVRNNRTRLLESWHEFFAR